MKEAKSFETWLASEGMMARAWFNKTRLAK
jgi:hypothetical protein